MSTEPLDWTDDGPRSPRFDDVYFSQVDGLAESRTVFLAGCGLPEAWIGRRRFTVAELGFGTGLNILALVALWAGARPPGARLHIFSIEAYPIAVADACRALAAWPELADLAETLLAGWPDGRRGLCRIEFPKQGAILDLAVAEVGPALTGWDGRADAWFLDGFAPARNPQMWSPEILALVAERSAPGARAATFTVAGAVRRGLAEAGFAVDKRPGFGRKRERLEARLDGAAPPDPPPPRVAVVGGGIAGAALMRAFRTVGAAPTLYEAESIGAGASGNPAAMVTPRLDAGLGTAARFQAEVFSRAVTLYRRETPEAILSEGALQLEQEPRDAGRFDRLDGWDGFAPDGLQRWDAAKTSATLSEPAAAGLWVRDALTVDPARVLSAWIGDAERATARVAALRASGGAWRLLGADGAVLGEADVVCVATGAATATLVDLPLRIVRGQVSWSAAPFMGVAAAWGGYATTLRDGVLFGATHDREDPSTEVRAVDDQRNLASLRLGRPQLAATIDPRTLSGRASLRVAAPDHQPLAGAVAGRPGLFVLTGLGGRGFTLAPLLAEQVAALALGAPRPLPLPLAKLVAAGRYSGRDGG